MVNKKETAKEVTEMQRNPLRGAVAEKFGNCTQFAKALGWSGRKTRDIVSRRQTATAKDISEMAAALDIHDPAEFVKTFSFLPSSPQKADS